MVHEVTDEECELLQGLLDNLIAKTEAKQISWRRYSLGIFKSPFNRFTRSSGMELAIKWTIHLNFVSKDSEKIVGGKEMNVTIILSPIVGTDKSLEFQIKTAGDTTDNDLQISARRLVGLIKQNSERLDTEQRTQTLRHFCRQFAGASG